MPIRVYCPLGHGLMAPDEYAGRVVSCPKCKNDVHIPNMGKAPPVKVAAAVLAGTATPGVKVKSATTAGKPAAEPPPPKKQEAKAVVPPPVVAPPLASPPLPPPKVVPPPIPPPKVVSPPIPAPPLPPPPVARAAVPAADPVPTAEAIPPPVTAEIVLPPASAAPQTQPQAVIEPAPPPTIVIPPPDQVAGAYYLSACVIAIALFSITPAVLEIYDYWQVGDGQSIAGWAYVLLLLAVLQIAYGVFVAQVRDWSSAWVISLMALSTAVLYAMLLGITFVAREESRLIQALQLTDKLANNKAAFWSIAMICALSLLSWFAGHIGARWHRAESLMRRAAV